jgi:O-methyltransferase
MDYHDSLGGATGYDVNPGVKLACDEFLASKPEKIVSLYGNQISHAFFRKVAS